MQFERLSKLATALIYLLIGFVVLVMGASVVVMIQPSLFDFSTQEHVWKIKDIEKDLPEGREGRLITYGYKLATETPKWIGPQATNEKMLFAGNSLACQNCHLEGGSAKGAISWVGITKRFPQFRSRENKVVTLEDRINGCMERSMNGRSLPNDSKQMEAFIAYMEWLSEDIPEEVLEDYKGMQQIALPKVAANPELGRQLYTNECQQCHGQDGQGTWNELDKKYIYPPLWGDDSYNHAAGMNRVITAAEFIKSNMPWGQATWDNPKLTDEEAYHIAAYIDSFERPQFQDTLADYPDLKYKPVSAPYGPYEDDFDVEQHKYGPFQPILTYYKQKYDIVKTK